MKTLAEKAVMLNIFQSFKFAFENFAKITTLASGNVRVMFCDNSHYIQTKDGDKLLPFLVSPENHWSHLPSLWIFAKSEIEAISLYKKDVKTNCNLITALPF